LLSAAIKSGPNPPHARIDGGALRQQEIDHVELV